MGCTDAGTQSEYEFVRSSADREPGSCSGPLLTLSFAAFRLAQLEAALPSDSADFLWDGFQLDTGPLTFAHCAAHWMDLSLHAGMSARLHRRGDWFNGASHLLDLIFTTAGWDRKEMANLLLWRRVQLT